MDRTGQRRLARYRGTLVTVDGEVLRAGVARVAGEAERAQDILRAVAPVADLTLWAMDLASQFVERYGPRGTEVGPLSAFAGRLHPADLARVEAVLQAALGGGAGSYTVDARQRAAEDGSYVPVRIDAVIQRDPRGLPRAIHGLTTGLQGAARSAETLRISDGFLGNLLQHLDVMVVGLDLEGRIRLFNRGAQRVTGWRLAEVVGERWFERLVPQPRCSKLERVFFAHARGDAGWEYTHPVLTRDGTLRQLLWRYAPFEAPEGRLWVAVGTDVTAQQREVEQLTHAAQHDGLTGLLNRAGLEERLGAELARGRRRGGQLALRILDLDGFKAVNDGHGHPVGDELLRAVADTLRRMVRAEDSVARLGGDEFAVLQVDVETSAAIALAERLVARLAEPWQLGAHSLHVGTSVGLTLGSDGLPDGETLLRQADAALYRAKAGGKGRYALHDARLASEEAQRSEALQALDTGLDAGVSLVWQPVVSLADGALVALEALARWPGLPVASTPALVRLAEEAGRVERLGAAVKAAMLQQVQRWRAAGLTPPVIVINLSPPELRDPGLPGRLGRLLKAAELAPGALELDVPRAAWQAPCAATWSTLQALARMGVRLALDDVGQDNLPSAVLERLPVARVKLHQAFPKAPTAYQRAVVVALAQLTHAAGGRLTAEGVEAVEQLEWLRTAGCDEVQGFLVASPAAAEALDDVLRSGRVALPRGPAAGSG